MDKLQLTDGWIPKSWQLLIQVTKLSVGRKEGCRAGKGTDLGSCTTKVYFLMVAVPAARHRLHGQITHSEIPCGPEDHVCCCPAGKMKEFEVACSPVAAVSCLPRNEVRAQLPGDCDIRRVIADHSIWDNAVLMVGLRARCRHRQSCPYACWLFLV